MRRHAPHVFYIPFSIFHTRPFHKVALPQFLCNKFITGRRRQMKRRYHFTDNTKERVLKILSCMVDAISDGEEDFSVLRNQFERNLRRQRKNNKNNTKKKREKRSNRNEQRSANAGAEVNLPLPVLTTTLEHDKMNISTERQVSSNTLSSELSLDLSKLKLSGGSNNIIGGSGSSSSGIVEFNNTNSSSNNSNYSNDKMHISGVGCNNNNNDCENMYDVCDGDIELCHSHQQHQRNIRECNEMFNDRPSSNNNHNHSSSSWNGNMYKECKNCTAYPNEESYTHKRVNAERSSQNHYHHHGKKQHHINNNNNNHSYKYEVRLNSSSINEYNSDGNNDMSISKMYGRKPHAIHASSVHLKEVPEYRMTEEEEDMLWGGALDVHTIVFRLRDNAARFAMLDRQDVIHEWSDVEMTTVANKVDTAYSGNENECSPSKSLNVLDALTREEEENDKISVFGVLLPAHVTPSEQPYIQLSRKLEKRPLMLDFMRTHIKRPRSAMSSNVSIHNNSGRLDYSNSTNNNRRIVNDQSEEDNIFSEVEGHSLSSLHSTSSNDSIDLNEDGHRRQGRRVERQVHAHGQTHGALNVRRGSLSYSSMSGFSNTSEVASEISSSESEMNEVHSHHRSAMESHQALFVPQLPQSSVLILSTNVHFEASEVNTICNTMRANQCSKAIQSNRIDHIPNKEWIELNNSNKYNNNSTNDNAANEELGDHDEMMNGFSLPSYNTPTRHVDPQSENLFTPTRKGHTSYFYENNNNNHNDRRTIMETVKSSEANTVCNLSSLPSYTQVTFLIGGNCTVIKQILTSDASVAFSSHPVTSQPVRFVFFLHKSDEQRSRTRLQNVYRKYQKFKRIQSHLNAAWERNNVINTSSIHNRTNSNSNRNVNNNNNNNNSSNNSNTNSSSTRRLESSKATLTTATAPSYSVTAGTQPFQGSLQCRSNSHNSTPTQSPSVHKTSQFKSYHSSHATHSTRNNSNSNRPSSVRFRNEEAENSLEISAKTLSSYSSRHNFANTPFTITSVINGKENHCVNENAPLQLCLQERCNESALEADIANDNMPNSEYTCTAFVDVQEQEYVIHRYLGSSNANREKLIKCRKCGHNNRSRYNVRGSINNYNRKNYNDNCGGDVEYVDESAITHHKVDDIAVAELTMDALRNCIEPHVRKSRFHQTRFTFLGNNNSNKNNMNKKNAEGYDSQESNTASHDFSSEESDASNKDNYGVMYSTNDNSKNNKNNRKAVSKFDEVDLPLAVSTYCCVTPPHTLVMTESNNNCTHDNHDYNENNNSGNNSNISRRNNNNNNVSARQKMKWSSSVIQWAHFMQVLRLNEMSNSQERLKKMSQEAQSAMPLNEFVNLHLMLLYGASGEGIVKAMQQAYLNKKNRHTLRELTQIHRSDGFDLSMSDHNSILSSSNATQEHIGNNNDNNNNNNNNNTMTANISESTTLLNYPHSVLVTAPAEHPRTMSVLDSESVMLQSMSSGVAHVFTPTYNSNSSKIKSREHEESSNRPEHPELIITTTTTTANSINTNNSPANALTFTANKVNQNGSPKETDLMHLTSVTETNLPHDVSEIEHTALPANEDNEVKCTNGHINTNDNDQQHENTAVKDDRTNLYDEDNNFNMCRPDECNDVEQSVFNYEDYNTGNGHGKAHMDAGEDEATPAIPDTLSPLTEDMKLFPDGVQVPLQLHYIRLHNTLYKVTEITDKTFLQYRHVRLPTSTNYYNTSSNTVFSDTLGHTMKYDGNGSVNSNTPAQSDMDECELSERENSTNDTNSLYHDGNEHAGRRHNRALWSNVNHYSMHGSGKRKHGRSARYLSRSRRWESMSRRDFGDVSYSFTPTLAPVPSPLKSSQSSPFVVSIATAVPSSVHKNNNNLNNNNINPMNGIGSATTTTITTTTTSSASPTSPLLHKLQNYDDNIVSNNNNNNTTTAVLCSNNEQESDITHQCSSKFNPFYQVTNKNSNNNICSTDQIYGLSASANDFAKSSCNSKRCLREFQFSQQGLPQSQPQPEVQPREQ